MYHSTMITEQNKTSQRVPFLRQASEWHWKTMPREWAVFAGFTTLLKTHSIELFVVFLNQIQRIRHFVTIATYANVKEHRSLNRRLCQSCVLREVLLSMSLFFTTKRTSPFSLSSHYFYRKKTLQTFVMTERWSCVTVVSLLTASSGYFFSCTCPVQTWERTKD